MADKPATASALAEELIPIENPVAVRRPLRYQVQEVSTIEPQSAAIRKVIDNQIALTTRVDQLDADTVELGAAVIRGFAGLSQKIDSLIVSRSLVVSGVPGSGAPMRRREDSIHAIEETAERVGEAVRAKAQRIVEDPATNLTPDVVKEMMKAELKQALATQREDDKLKKLEADAAAVEREREEAAASAKEKAKERRESLRLVWTGVVVGLVLLAAGGFFTYEEGHLRGHSEGFAERDHVSPAPVIVTPPATPPSLPTVQVDAPPAAPAAVAPKHR